MRPTEPRCHTHTVMCRHLSGPGGFDGAPACLGDVVQTEPDGSERRLAGAQAFVRNQGDDWGWTLGQLKRLLDDALVHDGAGPAAGAAGAGRRREAGLTWGA